MNDLGKYLLYFLLGGSIVSFSTYLGSQGKSFLAAMASTFPAITGVTFILLHANGGGATTVDYAKSLLWFVPPWTIYVVAMILGIPRLGFWRQWPDRLSSIWDAWDWYGLSSSKINRNQRIIPKCSRRTFVTSESLSACVFRSFHSA